MSVMAIYEGLTKTGKPIHKGFQDMTQTADTFLREQQMAIRAVLRKNTARKLQGKKKRGIKWIRGKQAQCALIGHVMIAKKCVYCGAEE